MRGRHGLTVGLGMIVSMIGVLVPIRSEAQPAAKGRPPHDAIAEAATPRKAATERPEQKATQHDRSGSFAAPAAEPSSKALESQPEKGQMSGFDFYRDPLGAKEPMQTFEETMKADIALKPKVMADQRKLLEGRYNLEPKLDPEARMSRGKPLAVGPTANGLLRDILASGSSFGSRLYRRSRSLRWSAITFGFAVTSAFIVSSNVCIGFLASSGSR